MRVESVHPSDKCYRAFIITLMDCGIHEGIASFEWEKLIDRFIYKSTTIPTDSLTFKCKDCDFARTAEASVIRELIDIKYLTRYNTIPDTIFTPISKILRGFYQHMEKTGHDEHRVELNHPIYKPCFFDIKGKLFTQWQFTHDVTNTIIENIVKMRLTY